MRRQPLPIALILAGGAILFLALGTRQSFGLFLDGVSSDLGWGREVFGFSMALQNLVWGLTQPLVGMIADKYGTARVLVVGAVAYAAGLAMMATSADALQFHLGAGILVGGALSAVAFATVLSAVGQVVAPERRGLALGMASMGGSMGQFVVVLLSHKMLGDLGWSAAFLVLAVATLFIAPLAIAFVRRPSAAAVVEETKAQSLGEAMGEAGRHGGYWLLTAGFFVCGFHGTFIMTHLPAFVSDLGLSGWVGAVSLSLIGLFNVVGTYACGALADRYRKKYLLSLLYVLRAAIIAVFVLVPPSQTSVRVFASAMGLLWLGTVPLTTALVADIFGPRYLATLFGGVYLGHQVGAFLGAWLGGLVYDRTGSYDVVWLIAIVLGLLAAALHWPIADRPVARLAGTDAAT